MTVELVVVKGPHRGDVLTLEGPELFIGRSQSANLSLSGDKKVSQLHAKLKLLDNGRYLVEDLGSTNGTYVNGRRLEAIPLRSGDRVRVGHSLLIYRSDEESTHSGIDSRMSWGDSESDLDDSVSEDSESEISNWEPFPTQGNGVSPPHRSGKAFFGALAEIVARLERRTASQGFDDIVGLAALAIGARRGVLLLREPMSGATTPVASYRVDDDAADVPLDPDVLQRVVTTARAVAPSFDLRSAPTAAPLRVGGTLVGAIYFDSPGYERKVSDAETLFLESVGHALSMALTQERQRCVALASADIIDLAVMGGTRLSLDLSAFLEEILETNGELARLRQITVTRMIPPGLTVIGDELFLRQALERLIEFVFSVANGAIQVAARMMTERNEVQVSIGYTGRGFDELGRSRVFHFGGVGDDLRFALHRGLDPALAICRALIELSRGSITITSAGVEAGATFLIALPAAGR